MLTAGPPVNKSDGDDMVTTRSDEQGRIVLRPSRQGRALVGRGAFANPGFLGFLGFYGRSWASRRERQVKRLPERCGLG